MSSLNEVNSKTLFPKFHAHSTDRIENKRAHVLGATALTVALVAAAIFSFISIVGIGGIICGAVLGSLAVAAGIVTVFEIRDGHIDFISINPNLDSALIKLMIRMPIDSKQDAASITKHFSCHPVGSDQKVDTNLEQTLISFFSQSPMNQFQKTVLIKRFSDMRITSDLKSALIRLFSNLPNDPAQDTALIKLFSRFQVDGQPQFIGTEQEQALKIRKWMVENLEYIRSVLIINLSSLGLDTLPGEISLFTGLTTLYLDNNPLPEIDLNPLPPECVIHLDEKQNGDLPLPTHFQFTIHPTSDLNYFKLPMSSPKKLSRQ